MSRPDIPVRIGADDSEFKSAMTRIRMQARTAANDTASSFMRIKSKVSGAGDLLGGAFSLLRGGPIGVASALGLGIVVSETQAAVDAVTDLGKAAKTAGVEFETFQELRYAAIQNRIEVDALTDGLKEMQLRADEFVKTGGGPAAESFERLGISARQAKQMLKDPAEMFDILIGKIKELDRAAQIRVLDEMFGGTAAEQFSFLMGETGQSIADAREEARAAGAVMDEELLRKAEDLNAKWETMSLVIGTNVKAAVIDVASLVDGMIVSLAEFLKETTKTHQMMVEYSDAGAFMGGMARGEMFKGGRVVTDDTAISDDDAAAIEEINSELEKRLEATRKITEFLDRQSSLTADQLALEREIERVRKTYKDAGAAVSEDVVRQKAEESLAAKKRRAEESRKSAAATKVEKDAARELIQALQDELQMTGMTADEKKVFENLRRAGTAATDDEKASIRELTLAIEDQRQKQEQAAETADLFRDSATDSFLSIVPAIETGNDALDRLINRLIEAAAQAALFGDGPLGGLFGGGLLSGIFPAHATGTNFTQGGMALVGERGPELVNLPRGGEVIPSHRLAMLSGADRDGSGAMVSNISLGGINITMPEGTRAEDAAAVGQEVRRQLDQFSRNELPARVQQIQRNPNRR